jgi:crotonobetainyl-CoA:carnitine CoA-transferase CaiB-like acyl-CoA transferase
MCRYRRPTIWVLHRSFKKGMEITVATSRPQDEYKRVMSIMSIDILIKRVLHVINILHGREAVFDEPQVAARNLIVEFPNGDQTPIRLVGSPINFSRTPVSHTTPPPRLGEHTEEILRNLLGESPERIKSLYQNKII